MVLLLPVWLLASAESPIAVFPSPVVISVPAALPTIVLLSAVVKASNAWCPIATLF